MVAGHDLFLFQHDFVNRNALCAALMLPLITVLEAPPSKSRTPVDEDTEEEDQEGGQVGVVMGGVMNGWRTGGCGYGWCLLLFPCLEKEFQADIVCEEPAQDRQASV